MPSSSRDLKRLSEEIVTSVAPLRNLRFTNRTTASYIGLSAVWRSADLDSYHILKEMCAKEFANREGALLAWVSFITTYILFGTPPNISVTWPFVLSIFQFNAHFLMFNLAAASDSRQRHAVELKEKLDATERKAGLRERNFNRQEEIPLNLQSEKNRVDSKARALRLRVSSLENQLRIAGDESAKKSKKIVVLEMDWDRDLEG